MKHNILFLTLAIMLSLPFGAGTAMAVSTSQIVEPNDTVVKPTRTRYRAQGYRIQIYSGSAGRKSKNEAYNAGEISHTFFPELSVYCHYKSPRWFCRIGDFPTREAAQHYVAMIRKSGLFLESNIVRTTVMLAQPPVSSSLENE